MAVMTWIFIIIPFSDSYHWLQLTTGPSPGAVSCQVALVVTLLTGGNCQYNRQPHQEMINNCHNEISIAQWSSPLHLHLQSLNALSLCLSIPQFDVLLRAINHWCQLHQWKQLFRIWKGQGNVAKRWKLHYLYVADGWDAWWNCLSAKCYIIHAVWKLIFQQQPPAQIK